MHSGDMWTRREQVIPPNHNTIDEIGLTWTMNLFAEERAVELEPGFFVGMMDYQPKEREAERQAPTPQYSWETRTQPFIYTAPQTNASQYMEERGGMERAEERIPQWTYQAQNRQYSQNMQSRSGPQRDARAESDLYRRYRSGQDYEAAGRFPGVVYSQYCEEREDGQKIERSSQQREGYNAVPQTWQREGQRGEDQTTENRMSAGEEEKEEDGQKKPSSRRGRRQYKIVDVGRVRRSSESSESEKERKKEQSSYSQSDREQFREVNILGKVCPTTYINKEKQAIEEVKKEVKTQLEGQKEKEGKGQERQKGESETRENGETFEYQ